MELKKKKILKDALEDIEYIFAIKNEEDYLLFIATENDEHFPFLFKKKNLILRIWLNLINHLKHVIILKR